MNFQRTDRKIRELNQHFDELVSSKNVDELEGHFSAFLASARSVTLALQTDAGLTFKDGELAKAGNVSGFADWYINKQSEMRKDELCKYFKGLRDVDLHTGNSEIQSNYHIKGPVTLSAPKGGTLIITARGTYEVFDAKTPKEKRIQKVLSGEETFQVGLSNPPKSHLGHEVENNDPISLCKFYKDYLENLIFEAKEKFLDS